MLSSTDTRGGNEVGVYRQSLGEEELVTGTYHTSVVQVHVVDEKPGADTVGFQCTSFLDELHVILVEEQARLVF